MLLILPLLCVWSSSAKCTVPQHPLLAPLVFIASCWAPKCALFKEGWGVGGCWARAGPMGSLSWNLWCPRSLLVLGASHPCWENPWRCSLEPAAGEPACYSTAGISQRALKTIPKG